MTEATESKAAAPGTVNVTPVSVPGVCDGCGVAGEWPTGICEACLKLGDW